MALAYIPPEGLILAYAGAAAPDGWALCQGQEILISAYPKLYAVVGTTYDRQMNPTTNAIYAAPTAGTFRVPDLRGLFLRGAGTPSGQEAVALGGHQAQKTAKNGLSFSDINTATGGGHNHTLTFYGSGAGNSTQGAPMGDSATAFGGTSSINATSNHVSHFHSIYGTTLNTSLTGNTETRPINSGVNYIIKLM